MYRNTMDQSPAETSPDVTDAVKIIRRTEQRRPRIGLILGSGLGALADSAEDAVAFDTSDLPGYPASTVEGHRGRIVFGSLEDVEIVVCKAASTTTRGTIRARFLSPFAFSTRLVCRSWW